VAAWAKTKGLEALKTFEDLLGDGRKYTAGDEFTVADTTAGHTLTIGEMIGLLDAAQYPKSAQLLKTLKERPAYQKIFNPPKSAE